MTHLYCLIQLTTISDHSFSFLLEFPRDATFNCLLCCWGSRISEGYVAELLHQALYALRHLHFASCLHFGYSCGCFAQGPSTCVLWPPRKTVYTKMWSWRTSCCWPPAVLLIWCSSTWGWLRPCSNEAKGSQKTTQNNLQYHHAPSIPKHMKSYEFVSGHIE